MTTGNAKIPVTVAVLTFNSGETLARALESVKDFAEIIVCDGGSNDETLNIARTYGARIISQDPGFKNGEKKIIDFAGVRNQTLAAASHGWFLYIDSDEYIGKEVAEEIGEIAAAGAAPAAYWVPRRYVLNGQTIDCAATYPGNKQIRFFHRDAVNKFVKTIHEKIELKQNAPVKVFAGPMFVPLSPDPMEMRRKWEHYITLECARRGRITFWQWLLVCTENAKISALYLFRFLRNLMFCRGARLPWRLERERHIYHVNICRRFWHLIGARRGRSEKSS
ncbi:glycosyltransferase [Patescibacteria group bacterium]|nr:glycosyltransferase [Patescibacteria group bacterium]